MGAVIVLTILATLVCGGGVYATSRRFVAICCIAGGECILGGRVG